MAHRVYGRQIAYFARENQSFFKVMSTENGHSTYRLIWPCFIIITGPSGVGKNSIIHKLRGLFPDQLDFAVSCTTRQVRQGEVNGTHYHFLTEARFQGLVTENAFLEHANVHGRRYGTLKSEVVDRLRAGRSVITDMDVQGAKQLLKNTDQFINDSLFGFFILPTCLDDLRHRLVKRGTDSAKEIDRRIEVAQEEILHARMFGREPIINYDGELDSVVFNICQILCSEDVAV